MRACWESISQRRFGSGGEGIIEIGSNDVGFIDEAYCWLPGFGVPVLRSPSLTSFFFFALVGYVGHQRRETGGGGVRVVLFLLRFLDEENCWLLVFGVPVQRSTPFHPAHSLLSLVRRLLWLFLLCSPLRTFEVEHAKFGISATPVKTCRSGRNREAAEVGRK